MMMVPYMFNEALMDDLFSNELGARILTAL